MKKIIKSSAVVSIFFLILSCGYKFSGKGRLTDGISEINVLMFENLTMEAGLSQIITNDLINEFSRNGITIANQFGKAAKNSVPSITGVIDLISTETISRLDIGTSNERRVKITVDIKLTAAGGKTIHSLRNISEEEAYKAYEDIRSLENAKINAIKALSERLAEKIYLMLTEDF